MVTALCLPVRSTPRCWLTLRALLLAGVLLWVSGGAQAHLLNMTKIEVRVEPAGQISVQMQVDLTRAAGGALEYYALSQLDKPLEDARFIQIQRRLENAIAVRLGTAPVAFRVVSAAFPKASREEFVNPLNWPMTQVQLVGVRPATDATQLQGVLQTSFPFEEPIALTFMAVGENRSMTRWLVAGQTSPRFSVQPLSAGAKRSPSARAPQSASESNDDTGSLLQYIAFGFTHILPKGLDHVLFVLGLYLGARSFKSLLILVTSFTLAHSITLGLATLGIFRLPASIVEPLIAASIVWVAVENLFTRAARWRPVIVFCFGLLHGLGFASALSDLHLPSQSFLLALLTFNAGIELGQLTLIGMALLVTGWFRQKPWYRSRIAVPASMVIAFMAAFWTVQRILFL